MKQISAIAAFTFLVVFSTTPLWALSSANIPLDSPVYSCLDKLAGFGLISSDIRGIKPFSKSEAARLLLEAERSLSEKGPESSGFASELVTQVRELLPREVSKIGKSSAQTPLFDYDPLSSLRLRYIRLEGVPRNYQRDVYDPGGDGVFGIGSGLRPKNPYPSPVHQRGSEGMPLFENNNGIVYGEGHSGELRWGSEWYLGESVVGMVEPLLLVRTGDTAVRINRGYLKLGGGSFELEVGKDENWLGLGYRGAITLTNNAENFTQVKISSPEPFEVKYFGAMKYAVVASRFDRSTVVINGVDEERQPWFYAVKLSAKPLQNLEVGLNLGRQVGGPGVNNSIGDSMRGLIGGTSADNSNGLAGFEARYRIPWLGNTEIYGELSGEDTALFWPIVESYVAGLYVPRVTDDGRNDFRFEFFQGNQILYTNGTFPGGYIYKNMPLGHSQGGATQDFFFRASHWFSARSNLALEYIYTTRGMVGRMPGQAVETKHAGRIFQALPLSEGLDAQVEYGIEKVINLNLVSGAEQTNQLLKLELRYRY